MRTSSVRFSQLRRVLLNLHFRESRTDTYLRFEHPESGTVFLFRPYAPNDYVTEPDLSSTRNHLEWRGLLPADAFDDKTPA